MGSLRISGQVIYAPGTWGIDMPAVGVRVEIVDRDMAALSGLDPTQADDFIFNAVTDANGNFDGNSQEWDDATGDLLALQARVTSDPLDGNDTTLWHAYFHDPSIRTKVVIHWPPPNVRKIGNVLVVGGRNSLGQSILAAHDATARLPSYPLLLKLFLATLPAGKSPVSLGSHDFWITFPDVPNAFGVHLGEDLNTSPRMLRGIVRMPWQLPGLDMVKFSEAVRTLLEEVGHHWLVPSDLAFDTGSGRTPAATQEDFIRATNLDAAYPGPILLGRDNEHWSCFLQADCSPMDGVGYTDTGTHGGVSRWEARMDPFEDIPAMAGVPAFPLPAKYSHLDQVIMGLRTAAEAYPQNGGAFRWIEPRLTWGLHDDEGNTNRNERRLPYFVGLYVAFARDSLVQFGFRSDHRLLEAIGPGGETLGRVVLDEEFVTTPRPLWIERVGTKYRFIVERVVREGCLTAIFRLLRILPFMEPRKLVKEVVAEWEDPRPPQAVGAMVRTRKGHEILAEGGFSDLQLVGLDESWPCPTTSIPSFVPADRAFNTLNIGGWHSQLPMGFARIRTVDSEFRILVPRQEINPDGSTQDLDGELSGSIAGGNFVDRAPRLMVRCPDTDFTLEGKVRVVRSMFAPWSYGRATGTTSYGEVKALPVSSLGLSQVLTARKQPPPPNDTYRFAFIIVAENVTDISPAEVQAVDRLRQVFRVAFEKATDGRRHADCTL